MLEAVSSQDGMALFDVDLHLILEAVTLQESVNGGHIVIILMLGRFLRFWFNQDRSGETDLMFVFDDHVQEPAKLIHFLADARIEQRLIALTTAP